MLSPPPDKRDAPSRPGLLLRFVCALLVLTVCAAPLLHRYSDEHLAVVHGAGSQTMTVYKGQTEDFNGTWTGTQINVNVNGTLNINSDAVITMTNGSGNNDESEIQVYAGATLNLYGKITGSFDRLSVASAAGSFNIYLCDGAVFDAIYNNEELVIGHSNLTCHGCNYGSNVPDAVDVKKANDDLVTPETTGNFNIADPGPVYTITANPVDGYSQVVWTKGKKGEKVIEVEGTIAETNYVLADVDENQVQIRLMENARYQVYATYIPDPKWTWTNNNTEATVTIYSYDPDEGNEYGIKEETKTADVTPDPDNDGMNLASVKVGDDTYTDRQPAGNTNNNGNGDDNTNNNGNGDDNTNNNGNGDGNTTNNGNGDGNTNNNGNGDDNTNNNDNGDGNTTNNGNGDSNTNNNGNGDGTNNNGNGNGNNNADNYRFTTDSVWSWKQGSTGGMPVVVKKTVGDSETIINNLVSVSVDGTLLTEKTHYTAVSGSIKITLLPSYLKTLSIGKHTLTVKMTDGTLQDTFTISASGGSDSDDPGKGDSSPKTGEGDGMLIFYTWLVIFSFGIIGSLIALKKKTKHAYR